MQEISEGKLRQMLQDLKVCMRKQEWQIVQEIQAMEQ
mgnify:FL=1